MINLNNSLIFHLIKAWYSLTTTFHLFFHRFNSFFKFFIFFFVSLTVFFIFSVFFSAFFFFISVFLRCFLSRFFSSNRVETRERRTVNITFITIHVSLMISGSKMSEIVLLTSIDWLNQIIKFFAKDSRVTKSMKSFSLTIYLINDVWKRKKISLSFSMNLMNVDELKSVKAVMIFWSLKMMSVDELKSVRTMMIFWRFKMMSDVSCFDFKRSSEIESERFDDIINDDDWTIINKTKELIWWQSKLKLNKNSLLSAFIFIQRNLIIKNFLKLEMTKHN